MDPSPRGAATTAWESSAVVALLESSHDGIMALAAERCPDGEIVDFRWLAVNPRAARIVGRSRERLMATTMLTEFPGNKDTGLFDAYAEVVRSGRPFHTQVHYEHDGLDHWFDISAVRLDDGVAVTFRDITASKVAELELTRKASHDPLTGLLNRAGLEGEFDAVSADSRRGHGSLFFIDLDRFKVINDSLGHAVGDRLLQEVGRRLAAAIRSSDRLARFGGDEFVVFAPGIGAAEASRFGDRLVQAVRLPVVLAGRSIVPTISVGAADVAASPLALGEALRNADAAMYLAKARGGNGCAVLDAESRARAFGRLDLEIELAAAVDTQQFGVFLQPVMDLRSGKLHGAEALVRWHHPFRGTVAPTQFVSIAEDCGLIEQIGHTVLRQVTDLLAHWAEHQGPRLLFAVNVSPAELVVPGFVPRFLAELERVGAAPSLFTVEITESAMAADAPGTFAALEALHDAGVWIAVDDFGTGFSAFERLRDFPVSVLKVDRSFVATMERSERDRRLVQGILSLARSLDLFTVAEGVQTERQAEMLADMGADFVQGYLYSPPVSPAAFAERWSLAPPAACAPPIGRARAGSS
jgi:diguanylate cyclase (GGDEF)-like protein/PAS domain S-box-containing protein